MSKKAKEKSQPDTCGSLEKEYSICPTCGKSYLNFCVPCERRRREEQVEYLMRQFGLTVENIISLLSEEVLSNRNFAALKLAIELLALKPASKTDITTDGQPLLNYDEVQKRLADKIARLAAGKGKA